MGRGSREAVIRMGVDRGYLRSSLGGAERQVKGSAGKIQASLKRTVSGGLSKLDVAGFLGVAGLAEAARDALDFEQRLVRLGVASRSSSEKMASLKKEIFAVAQARGVDAGKLLGGIEEFVALTGNIDAAADALDQFALIASATGSDVGDITTASAALVTNFGVAGDRMKAAFGILVAQGKAGAVELKDMASELAGLTPKFATFGVTGTRGLKQLGAALQIARSGFGSASETATGLQSLMKAIVVRSKDLGKIGVKVFDKGPDGVNKLRSFQEILFDIIDKSKGDPKVLQKVIGDKEAISALLPLIQKGKEGFLEMAQAGDRGSAELDRDFEVIAQSPAHKIEQAKQQLKALFNASLVKVLPLLATGLQKIADAVAYMASHSTEVIALIAALKGGGMLAGLSGGLLGGAAGGGPAAAALGLGGGAGAAGGWGAYGGAGRRRMGWRQGLGQAGMALGGAAQGAALGYGLSRVGADLEDNWEKASDVGLMVAGGMAGLPGPIGLVGKAMLGLEGVMQLATVHLDQKMKKIASAPALSSQFGKQMGRQLGISTETTYDPMTGLPRTQLVDKSPQTSGEVTPEQREGAIRTLNEVRSMGLTNPELEGGGLDRGKLKAWLKKSGMSPEEQAATEAQVEAAFRIRYMDQETNEVYSGTGPKPKPGKVWTKEMQAEADAANQPMIGPTEEQVAGAAALQPVVRTVIEIVPTDLLKAIVRGDDPAQRTGGGR